MFRIGFAGLSNLYCTMVFAADSNPIQRLTNTPLARSLVLSLSLHLALLAVVQVKAIPELAQARVIDARLVAASGPKQPQPEVGRGPTARQPEPVPELSRPLEVEKAGDPEPPRLPEATPVSPPPGNPVSAGLSLPNHAARLALPAELPSEMGVSVPALSATRWYGAREVDLHPKALQRLKPPYPEAARRRGQEGSVKIRFRIDEFGQVQEVEVVESSPPGVFDAAALETLRKVRFEPARKAGRPVRYDGEYRYSFVLD